ncbi:MAG: TonB family protein [Alphaproteobacteria bacterium]|nr:TonB family protein [Alphaproteobacteria bacterium]
MRARFRYFVIISTAVFLAIGAGIPSWAKDALVGCNSTRVLEGCGTWVWPDGSKYVGGFHGGYFTGHGVVTYADGSRLEGDFENATISGETTYITSNGTKFVGKYMDVSRDISQPHTVVHYPFWRAIFGGEDNVQMTVIIDEKGNVTNAQVDRPTEYPSFDKAAVDTVKLWKYLPATVDGHPVKAPYVILFQFSHA